jgi:hypothetical protein
MGSDFHDAFRAKGLNLYQSLLNATAMQSIVRTDISGNSVELDEFKGFGGHWNFTVVSALGVLRLATSQPEFIRQGPPTLHSGL